MAWTYKTVGSFSARNTAGNLSVSVASGISVDDLIVIHANTLAGDTISTPAGWTLVTSTSNGAGVGSANGYVFYKKAVSGDIGAAVALTCSGNYKVARMTCFSGQDTTTTPLDGSGANNGDAGGANTTISTGSTTTTRGYDLWLGCFSHDGNVTFSGYTLSGSESAVVEIYCDNYNYTGANYMGIEMGYAIRQATTSASMSTNNTGAMASWTGILAVYMQPVTAQTISPSVVTATATLPTPSFVTDNVISPAVVTATAALHSPVASIITQTNWTNTSKNSTTWTNISKS